MIGRRAAWFTLKNIIIAFVVLAIVLLIVAKFRTNIINVLQSISKIFGGW